MSPAATAPSACRRGGSCAPARRCASPIWQSPIWCTRDQNVTLIYESSGLYLTIRGKAMEGGTEGDVVNVLNLQSKRTVSGVVVGRGQVSVAIADAPRFPPAADASATTGADRTAAAPVSVAANNTAPGPRKAE